MKRDFLTPQLFPGELIIDNFAGGGGTSTGLEEAFGRPVASRPGSTPLTPRGAAS